MDAAGTAMLHRVRKAVGPALLAAGVIGALALGRPATVSATTGPTYALPPSHYHVSNKIELLYVGEYVLTTVDRAARLSGGAMGIIVDDRGFLTGLAQFYGYDAQGMQDSWTATLYNFRLAPHNIMASDLLDRSGKVVLARLYMQRTSQGDLVGHIELGGRPFAISWHKIANH